MSLEDRIIALETKIESLEKEVAAMEVEVPEQPINANLPKIENIIEFAKEFDNNG